MKVFLSEAKKRLQLSLSFDHAMCVYTYSYVTYVIITIYCLVDSEKKGFNSKSYLTETSAASDGVSMM